jgi:uncharacterized protein Yka (UPF0111/DUF47 family)
VKALKGRQNENQKEIQQLETSIDDVQRSLNVAAR